MTRLLLTVEPPTGPGRDVEVEGAPDATVGDALDALSASFGLTPGPTREVTGHVARMPGDLDRTQPLATANLRYGDRLALTLRPKVRREGTLAASPRTARLLAIGGPLAGRSFDLAMGVNTVGRSTTCTVTIDDDSVSRHHLTIKVEPTGITVQDAGSTNGSKINGRDLVAPQMVRPETLIEAGDTVLRVDVGGAPVHSPMEEGLVVFNRPPRVDRPYQGRELEFPAPPERSQGWPVPVLTALAPLGLGLLLFAYTRNPATLLFTLLSPVMLVGAAIEARRGSRREFARQSEVWRRRSDKVLADLHAEHRVELEKRRAQSPDPAAIVARGRDLLPSLYERAPDDVDFLRLRVGVADLPTLTTATVRDGGDDDLRATLEESIEPYATAIAVPAVVSMPEHGSIGVAGPAAAALALGRWLLLQAVCLHSPSDVAVVALVGPSRQAEWEWVKWLPHTRSTTSPLAGAHQASTPLRAAGLVDALVTEVRARQGTAGKERVRWPALFVLVDESVPIDRPRLTALFEQGPGVGVYCLWVGSDPVAVPYGCGAVAEVAPDTGSVTLGYATDGVALRQVTYEPLTIEAAREVSRHLAPVVDNRFPLSRDQGVPSTVPLVDLLGGADVLVDVAEIERRWAGGVHLRAPVGRTAQGELTLDLRSDGPHALVAGTTGSGKSEFLQAFVAGLAATHPPTKVSFVLVDYKGGAAFKACKDLPHTVGFVTDLNEHLVHRALVSLNAEVIRREHILDDHRAKDIIDLEQKAPAAAPPSLAIVIDEFAALAKEVPDFVEGVVDIAARGRSLGMHLVLATQRPAGVVTDAIRANTNLRVALRVTSEAESTDVIGDRIAASIEGTVPGRAYVQIGRQDPLLFQSGFAGTQTLAGKKPPPVVVSEFEFEGAVPPAAPTERATTRRTDLEDLVSVVNNAWAGMPRPASPWLDPLPPVVDLLAADPDAADGLLVVGQSDRPREQRQEGFALDLDSDGSVLVFGAGGSGKSVALRTIAVAAARAGTPDTTRIFGLDFASGALGVLRSLPHVAGVFGAAEPQPVMRLLRDLKKTIEVRRSHFAEAGASTLTEMRRAPGGSDHERIIVLLDGFAGFTAAFERVAGGEMLDLLPRLVVDGRTVGIHFAIAADRRGAVSMAVAGAISRRLVLRQSSPDEYAVLGVAASDVDPDAPPGRASVDGLEVQVALVGDETSGPGQQAAIDRVADNLMARHGRRAPQLRLLAERVDAAGLPAPIDPLHLVLGQGDEDLAPAGVDLTRSNVLVGGPIQSGRTTTLGALAWSAGRAPGAPDLYLVSARRRELVGLCPWTDVAVGDESAVVLIEGLIDTAVSDPTTTRLLFVDDLNDLTDPRIDALVAKAVKTSRDTGLRIVAAGEAALLRRSFGGGGGELRKDRCGILLQPDIDNDGDVFSVRLPRQAHASFPPGRGFTVQRGTIELVQVAQPPGLVLG